MIIVTVELLSPHTGIRQELARMHICNDGTGTQQKANYDVRVLRGRSKDDLNRSWNAHIYTKQAKVLWHPRLREHVWNLVGKALHAAGYKHD